MKYLGLEFFEEDKLDPNVLVPLSQAKRHQVVEVEYQRRQSEEKNRSGDGRDKKDGSESEESGLTMSSAEYSPYTIKGLRAEVMEDMKNSGHDSVYDSECCVVVRRVVADGGQ